MRRLLLLLSTVAVMLLGLAPAAAADPVDVGPPCVLDADELDGRTEEGRGRAFTITTTDATITGVFDTAESLTVHYKIAVTVERPYAVGRPDPVTTVYDAVCHQEKDGGGEPSPPSTRDPVCGSPARCALIEAIYDGHRAALDRGPV